MIDRGAGVETVSTLNTNRSLTVQDVRDTNHIIISTRNTLGGQGRWRITRHGKKSEPMMTYDPLSQIMKSPEFMVTLFDSIPCGVVVVDDNRQIVAANRIFENAVGLEQGQSIGSCEGEAIGCLNAGKDHNHFLPKVDDPCQTCGARHLAIKALKMGGLQRGRAHFQINVGNRVEGLEK